MMAEEQISNMARERESSYEALVYSGNRETILRCCRAFSDIPLNWMTLDNASLTSNYLAKERFDFVLLDLDTADGPDILRGMSANKNSHGVVLVITEASPDPAALDICYKSQFFYPVRPDDIANHLNRAVHLVERSLAPTESVFPMQSLNSKQQELLHNANFEHHRHEEEKRSAIRPAVAAVGSRLLAAAKAFFRNQHSLSIVAQERAASAIAAFGAIWFVSMMTSNFFGLEKVGPPPRGPVEMIGLAVLLWLCAKHRRVNESRLEHAEVRAS